MDEAASPSDRLEEGEGGKETESDVEGGVKGGGKREKKKESNASGIEFEKTWMEGREKRGA